MASDVALAQTDDLVPPVVPSLPMGRWAVAGRVLHWAVRVGLLGGLAFGWAQTIALGWRYRSLMGLRLWSDALSYSGLAHSVLWTLHGAVIGIACALLFLVSCRLRRSVAPGALALAILTAGASTFLLWPLAAVYGVAIARGVNRTWAALMAGAWVVVMVSACVVANLLAGTWLARLVRRVARLATWPAVAVLLLSLVIQWFERPRLLTSERSWSPSMRRSIDARASRPNVILVVLDTQRVDRLGCYGYQRPTTPQLDAFAADATIFENCIAPAIWTLPSHASIFTGLFPGEHGATYDHMWLDDGFVTMAELLGQLGYETICLSNNVWISAGSNLSQGFDRVIRPAALHQPRGNSISEFLDRVLYPGGAVTKWLGAITSEDAGAKFTGQLVARWLDRRDTTRPFFMFINYLEPHHPYRPHLPHRAQFIEPNYVGLSFRYEWTKGAEFSLLKQDCYTPDELKLLSDTYDGETRMLDDYVGELFAVLAERVALDDSVVIITADHGENLGEHHLLAHSWCVYDTLAHVPLIIRYPKRLRPGRSKDLVQLVDLLPTVMDAVQGRPVRTASTFGRTLLPSPETATVPFATTRDTPGGTLAADLAGRLAVVERIAPRRSPLDRAQQLDVRFDRGPFKGVLRAIRQGPWKYIVAGDGREELYQVVDDPGETRNLIGEQRGVAQGLAKRLAEWLAATRPYAPSDWRPGGRSQDDEMRRRLRDLGYI